jgi:hypothetical protein
VRGISAGIVACAIAAATVGCGSVQAPRTGAAAHPAVPAPAGNPTTGPGVPTGPSPGCPGAAPARPAGATLVITLAGNGKTYCVRVGDTLRVDLRAPGSSAWLRPLAGGSALVPAKSAPPTRAPGVTSASFAAMRPGQAVMTSVRPPCHIAIGAKGGLEPGFPVPTTYPLRFCAPGHRFSVSVIVLRQETPE